MVEKISESIAKSIAEVDVSSDKSDFLDLINKKKKDKKPADMHDMAAIVLSHIPQLLNKSATQGGGTKLTDAKVAANTMQPMSHLLLDDSSDKALRNKILAVAGQLNAGKSPAQETKISARVNDARANAGEKVSAAAQANAGEKVSAAALANAGEKAAAAALASASKALSETSLVDSTSTRPLAARKVESESATSQNSIADASLLQRGQAPVMSFSEASFTGAQRNETAARGEKSQVQTNAMQAVVSSNATEKPSVDLNYQFQRWSGDHSVKVSIPTDVRGESNITMLPSDTRAADALSRHISQLPGQKAELLQPKATAAVEVKRDGNTAAAITDPRAVDSSARLTAQSPEPASELYHAQSDSEERERQRQQHGQEEEQE